METLIDFFLWFFAWIWQWILNNPGSAMLLLIGILGLMGTLIETGKRGVLFDRGRVRRVLEPGFHLLIPILHQVQKVHMRDRTLEIYRQKVTSRDGLVYFIDVNIVFRIDDPKKVLIEVNHLKEACEAIVAIRVQKTFAQKNALEIQQKETLEQTLEQIIRPRLQEWGVELIRVGFTSISPSIKSLKIIQLPLWLKNRKQVLQQFQTALSRSKSLYLLGSERKIISKAQKRYHQKIFNPFMGKPLPQKTTGFEIQIRTKE